MTVNPGELTKTISIYRKNKQTDADGYETSTLVLVHSCHAKFSRQSGKDIIQANADFAKVNARFLIRHTKHAIDRKMIVRYNGHDYEIVYVNDYSDGHEYIEIWAELLTLEADI